MDKQLIKWPSEGDFSTLILQLPSEFATCDSFFAIPLISRNGGLLMAIPSGTLKPEIVARGQSAEEADLVGPSSEIGADMLEEDDEGQCVQLEEQSSVLVVDFADAVLEFARSFDPVTDSTATVLSFDYSRPTALPSPESLIPLVLSWAGEAEGRVHFYSAREEPAHQKQSAPAAPAKRAAPKRVTTASLAEQIGILTTQVGVLMQNQKELHEKVNMRQDTAKAADGLGVGVKPVPRMPSLSSALSPAKPGGFRESCSLIGPPPKISRALASPVLHQGEKPHLVEEDEPYDPLQPAPPQDAMVRALAQQSEALTSLVVHLAGGDPLQDLSMSSGGQTGLSLNTKGVQRREKLQQELANGASTFFLQVQQQIYKKMYPGRPLPRKEEDLVGQNVSMASYLERFGGFKGCRETGFALWVLAHAMDSAAQGNFHMSKEYMALLAVSLEQSSLDHNWDLAFILSLSEEPPMQMFQDRLHPVASLGRPFSPLCPPSWAAVALSYLKELEVLNSRKQEARGGKKQSQQKSEDGESPSPKRKPRFPKKPKASSQEASQ